MDTVPLNITGALAAGEITTYEFVVLAWLERMGEWHGTTTELHAALRWPHGVKHLRDNVLRPLRDAGLLNSTMRDRSRSPYTLSPVAVGGSARPHEQSDCGAPGTPAGGTTLLHSAEPITNETETECIAYSTLTKVGTHHVEGGVHRTLGSGLSGSVASQDGLGSREARDEGRPNLAGLSREQLVRLAHAEPEAHAAIRAELERRKAGPAVAERFASYRGDERTGDTTGDDEAAQVRDAAANPVKQRARRRQKGEA